MPEKKLQAFYSYTACVPHIFVLLPVGGLQQRKAGIEVRWRPTQVDPVQIQVRDERQRLSS